MAIKHQEKIAKIRTGLFLGLWADFCRIGQKAPERSFEDDIRLFYCSA
jgi:hypothetical protein